MSELSDGTGVLEAPQARGRSAGERLVESTYRQVYAALFGMCRGDAELAADLTQETYRKAWQGLASFDGRAQLSTWLFRIAYNTFLNHVRRPRPLQDLDAAGAGALADPAPDATRSCSPTRAASASVAPCWRCPTACASPFAPTSGASCRSPRSPASRISPRWGCASA